MVTFTSDSMTGTNWQNLAVSHVGEIGADWTQHPTLGGTWYIYNNKVHCGVTGACYSSGIPASADYTVQCDYTMYTDIGALGIAGRMSTSVSTFFYTYYLAGELVLAKQINGVITSLGADVTGLMTNGNTYQLKLEMIGSAIKVYVDGVQKISVTDATIPAAGRAAVRSSGANDAGTGKHIDNFLAFDTSVAAVTRARFMGIIG